MKDGAIEVRGLGMMKLEYNFIDYDISEMFVMKQGRKRFLFHIFGDNVPPYYVVEEVDIADILDILNGATPLSIFQRHQAMAVANLGNVWIAEPIQFEDWIEADLDYSIVYDLERDIAYADRLKEELSK